MPKSIPVVPDEVFRPGAIHFHDILVNAYSRSVVEESARFSPDDLVHIWRDMCAIREFETILNEIKTKGAYKGVTYNHAGPAHLSIGQEAAAVGMAYSADPQDHIFGSHRSHGEIIAKGLSAIRRLGDDDLEHVMRSYRDGAVLARWRRCTASRSASSLNASSYTAPTARCSRARPASTGVWAAPCTRSSPLSGSTPTTPSSAARARSRPARPCSSASIAGLASWWPTSATVPSAVARCGRVSPLLPWTSTASCGTRP